MTVYVRFAGRKNNMLVIIAALIIVGLIGHQLEKAGDYIFMIKVQYACFGAAAMGLLALCIGNPQVGAW
jgi:hypothetical protein